ncbi:MAG: PAS domain-containing protein, partial [Terriglobales bacterium]
MVAETQTVKKSNGGLDLRNLIETIPALVVCALPDGSVEFANRAWQEYTGFATGQLSRSNWRAAIHPTDAPTLVDEWNAALANGSTFRSEVRLRRSDGEYRWFLITKALAVTPTQNNELSLRTLIACEDINERERLKDELRHERDRVRLLLEITNGMTSKLDLRGLVEVLSTNLLSVT